MVERFYSLITFTLKLQKIQHKFIQKYFFCNMMFLLLKN